MSKKPPPPLPEARETLPVPDTYQEYFLQYASYVITDRAIPDIADGLKPVQRRILHSLWENEDGRYNKVANLVGHSMKYHPHGDASIYAAMVGVGQKGLLIDTQGNWGDPVTGDSAAAARYIEARLTPFAKEVVFAPQLTAYKLSYDGRNKEPLLLPVRFPLLLAVGTEGIAVGLSTRILPHNFIELLQAQKAYLNGEEFEIHPDFPTGGIADVGGYQDGLPGSRVRVRALLEPGPGSKCITIRELPFGTTTESVIDSILSANEKGKIKVSKVDDNSAADVEIVVHFQRGVDMDKAEDALYAVTDCEVSLSSHCNVILDDRPATVSVSRLLMHNADQTRELLRRDLEIQLERLEKRWHQKSLVQIFIENRVYLRIEKCKTWEAVLSAIDRGLEPHKERLRRDVAPDDLVMLTEVKIRRISAWDAGKAREELQAIDEEIGVVRGHLSDVTAYTLGWLDHLLEKYGKGRERRTRLESFGTVKAVAVVERTSRLFVDAKAGFIGTELKGEGVEEVGVCSDLDDVMVVRRDGALTVCRVAGKKYVGEGIAYVQIFAPEDRDAVFDMAYTDVESGRTYAKRFTVGGITRDKSYGLGKSSKTKVLWFAREDEEHFIHLKLRKQPRLRKTDVYVRFTELLVKGRGAGGVALTKFPVSRLAAISAQVYANRTGQTEGNRNPQANGSPAASDDAAGIDSEADDDSQKSLF